VAIVSPHTPLWQPSNAFREGCNLTRYARWLAQAGYRNETAEAQELYQWSVSYPQDFWRSIAEYFEVRFYEKAATILEGETTLEARWFPGATLNYAEHLLRGARECPNSLAVIGLSEPGSPRPRQTYTFAELGSEVSRVAGWLREHGVRKGDRVVGLLPNCPEAAIALLATASVGAIWSSCPPELSAKGVLDRWTQIAPAAVFCVSSYRYGGKIHDRRETIAQIRAGLSSLRAIVQVRNEGEDLLPPAAGQQVWDWPELGVRRAQPETLSFEPVEFEHPLWILYSSGTTGIPKPIVHGHGGMLLEHLKALGLHLNLGTGDRFFWFTTAGWMMWNFLISGLGLKTAIVLYDGSPKFPDFYALWRLAAEEKLTYFGTSAPFLQACEKAGIEPRNSADLASLRAIGSTGAPLSPEGFGWVYRGVKSDVWLGSASGGTDVCTAFVLSHPWLPVYPGKLQCRGLGAPIESWNEEGKPVWNEVGEMVLTGPMPCMPVGFWNDPQKERFRAAYFDYYPGIWRHGDWLEIGGSGGQCIIYGRSDSTLNRAGVRLGTSEFYRVIEGCPGIAEALVIDTTGLQERSGRLLLFVVLEDGTALDEEFRKELEHHLKKELSPRYVPDEIYAAPGIPHTLNGKKLEVPVKRIFEGKRLDQAISREAVSNPGCLEFYVRLAAERGGGS
jgi:acetoacetyl-CoA synthetase